ncbi:MAG: TonB-dependent receptor [Prevotellaceae bacterium]|jgi:outer membrane receptor for ferrienterochelin and colicin|nr:TonB-dependent receptor [Prevotellaceae bacterium]
MYATLGISLHAQGKIQITLLEKGTEKPLQGATVLYSSDSAMTNAVHAVSGELGGVSLAVSDSLIYCRITMTGFLPLSLRIAADSVPPVLHMQQDIIGLSGIVVTASRMIRPVKTSPVMTQVIGGRAMVDAGYGNLQQALQHEMPGLNIQKTGFGNEINMQGLDARHVLFLIDGERMTGDMAGNLDYERFNLHAIDRMEIVKGASSTLYGSRASGAVINLISKKTVEPLSITAGMRCGQMNERNYPDPSKRDFLYMFEKNSDRPNLQGWISAGFRAGSFTSQTDVWSGSSDAYCLYQQAGDRKVYTREANPFLKEDIVIGSILERPPMGVEGSDYLSASQKLFFEPSKRFNMQIYGTAFLLNSYDMLQDLVFTQAQDYAGGAKLSWNFKDLLSLNAGFHSDFYDSYKRHELRDERRKVYHSRIIQPRLTLTSLFFDGHSLVFGVEHFSDRLASDRFDYFRMSSRALKETEFFARDEWTLNSRWTVSAGIRTCHSPQFGLAGMPQFAAKYSPDGKWAFRLNASTGYRSPSIKELFFKWDHQGMFLIKGNEYLRPEKNRYLSLGWEYSGDRLFVNTVFYGNFFRDKIEGVWRIYDMQYNFEYINLGRQDLLGGEMLARWQPADCLLMNASYSYVNVSDQRGWRINTSSPHAATGSVEYRRRRTDCAFAATFSVSFMGQKSFDVQDRVFVPDEGRSREAYFRCDLPAYALCNVFVSQTFFEKAKITLGVNNIFNYRPETLGSGLTAFNIPATAGARCYVQLELTVDRIINFIKRKK